MAYFAEKEIVSPPPSHNDFGRIGPGAAALSPPRKTTLQKYYSDSAVRLSVGQVY